MTERAVIPFPQRHNDPKAVPPINYQRLLDIALAHVHDPAFNNIRAWYYVGRNRRLKLKSIKEQFGAESADLTIAYTLKGEGLFKKFFEIPHYDIALKNPATLVRAIEYGRKTFPLATIKVFSPANIEYAGFLLETMQAVVKPEFFPELKKLGFACWPAGEPYNTKITEGPFRNVYTLEESFPGAPKQWFEDCDRGEGGPLILRCY